MPLADPNAVSVGAARAIHQKTAAAETALGRDIQKQSDAPSALVDRRVRQAAAKQLGSMKTEGTKPN